MKFTDIERRAIINLKKNNSALSMTKIYKIIRPDSEMKNDEFMEMMDIISDLANDNTEYITDADLTNKVIELKKTMSKNEIYTFLLSERILSYI